MKIAGQVIGMLIVWFIFVSAALYSFSNIVNELVKATPENGAKKWCEENGGYYFKGWNRHCEFKPKQYSNLMTCLHPKSPYAEQRHNKKGELWYKWWCKKCKKTIVGKEKNLKLI